MAMSTDYNYAVPGTVPVLAQPTNETCWATAATMLFSWRDNQSYTFEHAMDMISPYYRARLDNNKPLLDGEEADFLAVSGLIGEPPANYTIDGILRLLQNYGPLWVTLNEDPANIFSHHALVITEMFGDGTPDGTFLQMNDPDGGVQVALSFTDYVQKFESVAGSAGTGEALLLQIIHV